MKYALILMALLTGCARPIGYHNGQALYVESIKIKAERKRVNGVLVCPKVNV